jgi:hypothetical protein
MQKRYISRIKRKPYSLKLIQFDPQKSHVATFEFTSKVENDQLF